MRPIWLLRIIAAFLLAQRPSLHSGAHSFLPDQNFRIRSIVCRKRNFKKIPSLQLLNLLDMFDNKMLKVQSARETLFPRLKCVCVCVCVCARARARHALKLTSKVHFELQTHPNDQIHTKHVKTAGLESIHYSKILFW